MVEKVSGTHERCPGDDALITLSSLKQCCSFTILMSQEVTRFQSCLDNVDQIPTIFLFRVISFLHGNEFEDDYFYSALIFSMMFLLKSPTFFYEQVDDIQNFGKELVQPRFEIFREHLAPLRTRVSSKNSIVSIFEFKPHWDHEYLVWDNIFPQHIAA